MEAEYPGMVNTSGADVLVQMPQGNLDQCICSAGL
jgi:hypothetical protein